jgi:multidrug efflux system membrane fusion protein
VATSINSDGMVVIQGGVTPGEIVVTDGQLRLTPGAAVVVKDALSAEASAEAPTRRP